MLRNLLQEISNNRFKCQAIIQGRDAVYFETFSWDSLRLSRYFSLLSENKQLVSDLYNLYLSIYAGNIRVAAFLTAIDSQIRNLNSASATMSSTAGVVLRDFINIDLLPKLNTI